MSPLEACLQVAIRFGDRVNDSIVARPGPELVLGGELSLLARQVPVTRSKAAITVTKHPGCYAVAHSQ